MTNPLWEFEVILILLINFVPMKGQINSKERKIVILHVPISDLNPAIYNPRKHTDKQFRDLKESIIRYWLVDPIIVNGSEARKGIVIGGHFRLKVAKELWYSEVPVVYLHIPDIEQEKELNLRLNQNTWDWDMELLRDFDMGLLLDVGFDNTELGELWDSMLESEDDHFDVEKEIEKLGDPISKLGDIYMLGKHRIMCGESTSSADVEKLVGSMEWAKGNIWMLYFDPPYNIGLDYTCGINKTRSYWGKKTNDNKSPIDYQKLLELAIGNGLAVSSSDTHVFSYCDSRYIGMVQMIFEGTGIENRRVCLWIKNNFNVTPNVAFNKTYEPCVYGTRWKPYLAPKELNCHEILNKEVGTGNQALEDIYDHFDIWLVKRLPSNEYEHPTAKPPTLHEKPLRRCTKANDIVLDLFGWSGSTLVACEQLGRRALLMDYEPLFIDLIIRRYELLTGQKASKLN